MQPTQEYSPIGGAEMRLISRHRHHRRAKAPRISISQAEIATDLHYPAGRRPGSVDPEASGRRGAR
jgi:hypothetical protein